MKARFFDAATLTFTTSHAAIDTRAGHFDFTTGTVVEAGDTWVFAGGRYRLYGQQSWLRGTGYTDAMGGRRDCGEASIAVLAAFVKDSRPVCALVTGRKDLTFAVCYALVGGQRLDLAMMMIGQGYGFASIDKEGMPISSAYAVAEQRAREMRRGLWQFYDVHYPAILLGRAAGNQDKGP
jgi:endonuclease YncB( thermonuclease family)